MTAEPPAAKDYFQKALAIQERLAPGSMEVSFTLNFLGLMALNQGDVAGAKDYFQKALAIRERLAPVSLDLANSLMSLGGLARERGDLAGARDYYQKALDTARLGGPSDPLTVDRCA